MALQNYIDDKTKVKNDLKELKNKYPVGSKIANPEYGSTLTGKHFLEIPESNRTFFEASKQLKKLAKDYEVNIIFKPE